MYDTYVVNSDDTLQSIALKFGTTPQVLKGLNGNIGNLVPGTMIMVPTLSSKYFDYYTINKGDTLYKIATKNNINPTLLAELNGLNENDYIYPNQVLLVPKAGSILYITAIGDTLNEVVKGLGANIDDLMEQNSKLYLQPEQLIVYKYK